MKESWDADIHPLMDMKALAKTASEYCKLVIITGGEPLMWNLDVLTEALKDNGCRVHIETSGAHPLSGHLDWITLSPKKTKLPLPEVYEKANELKMVIFNNHDFKFAEQQAEKVSNDCLLYIQTEWSRREQNYPKIIEFILNNPQWRYSVQTHKYLDIR